MSLPERHALERLLSPHELFPIVDEPGQGTPTWLQADGWRLFASPGVDAGEPGEAFQRFTLPDGSVTAARVVDASRAVRVPFNLAEAHDNLVSERWRAGLPQRGLTGSQLSAYYRIKRLVPRQAQLRARRALVRRQGFPEFPAWPLEESLGRLLRFYARCLLLAGGGDELAFDWFWPAPHRAAVILTHDVESAEGLRLAIEIADLEEERGLRSSFNIVARRYRIDEGLLGELRGRGFELGVHGVYHDRSMFSSRAAFESQLPVVREFASRLGAAGFRSPATHRVFEWLADLPVDYDCSVPHSDPFEPVPGGCCSLWPFFVGGVVELPYTLPQDHTLFTLLGDRSISVWQEVLDRLDRLNGLAQFLSHPDPGYLGDRSKRALYVELLDLIRDRPGLWKPLPREVAQWWRQRDGRVPGAWPVGVGVARLDESGAIAFEPQVPAGSGALER
jgi:peptidoglycan/xylan/chitin deacetylase (PgdA/CDA1 family)